MSYVINGHLNTSAIVKYNMENSTAASLNVEVIKSRDFGGINSGSNKLRKNFNNRFY